MIREGQGSIAQFLRHTSIRWDRSRIYFFLNE